MVRKVRYDEVRRVKEQRGGLSVVVGKERVEGRPLDRSFSFLVCRGVEVPMRERMQYVRLWERYRLTKKGKEQRNVKKGREGNTGH